MFSTLKLTTATQIGRQQQKKLSLILSYLIDNPDAGQFLHPVDWKQLQINDYPLIIKHPMNLLKVQDKLKNREYRTLQEVLDHIQLIWDNCKTYNKEGPFYALAQKLERSYKKMIKNYLPNIQIVVPSIGQNNSQVQLVNNIPPQKEVATRQSQKSSTVNKNVSSSKIQNYYAEQQSAHELDNQLEIQQIPPSQKNRFHQRLKQLTQQELAQIVLIIQQNCSQAFKQLGSGRYQILMDNVDVQSFKKMNEKIDELIEQQKGFISSNGTKKKKVQEINDQLAQIDWIKLSRVFKLFRFILFKQKLKKILS